MVLMGTSLEHQRLRAPRADGGTLIEPPRAAVGDIITRNAGIVGGANYELAGRSLAGLARQARGELLYAALAYTRSYRDVSAALDPAGPILLAGHQPQLFHPGVWFKNFVLASLAEAHAGVAVNLVIDSDTIKSASLRVPGGSVQAPVMESVPFDRPSAEIPFEERQVLDPACLQSFGQRAAQVIAPLVPQPLVEEFWPLVTARAEAGANLGECLSQARHQQEGKWNVTSVELPQSRICSLPAFHWFTAHLLGDLPRLRREYNASVAEFRHANHVRSMSHPVPDLAQEDGLVEAPYWIWSDDNPRRRRAFVARQGNELVLTDRQGIHVRLACPCTQAPRTVEQLAELKQAGIKLRTRALMTTLFARLFLGDLFIHGIGGAKYDQVTDRLITRFFGVEPPGYLAATATLRLPVAHVGSSPEDRRLLDQRLRELDYHPERYAASTDAPAAREWTESKARWIATPPTTENAQQRHQGIVAANAGLQPWVADLRGRLLEERQQVYAGLRAEAILSSREHAFCLFPAATLKKMMVRAAGC